jgi:hypothetical protein
LNAKIAQGQASSAKEIDALVTLVKTGRVKMDALEAERDQLKARWDELKSFFTHEEHPILPNRLEIKRKMSELEREPK